MDVWIQVLDSFVHESGNVDEKRKYTIMGRIAELAKKSSQFDIAVEYY